jgi:7-cyano-7-deazaguanine reductase
MCPTTNVPSNRTQIIRVTPLYSKPADAVDVGGLASRTISELYRNDCRNPDSRNLIALTAEATMSRTQKKKAVSRAALTSTLKSLVPREAVARLTALGDKPTATASKLLEVFPSPAPRRDFVIHMQIPEFTCLCPKTGQPDFATLYLDYIPNERCVELKSLKRYIWSFRDEGKFHEAVANEILDDIVAATAPRFARLTAKFWVRGGVFTSVIAEHRARGWKPAPAVLLQSFADESSVAAGG